MLTPEQLDDAGESVAEVYRQIEAELLDYLTQAIIDNNLSAQRSKTALDLLSQSMPQKVKAIIDEHSDEISEKVQKEVETLLEKSDKFDLARIAQDALGITTTALTTQTLAVTTSIKDLLARDNLALSEAARAKYLQWTTWATTQVATGNMTADKAMKQAVRELARGGLSIPFVTYKNEETGDVTITNHADVAIQRHIRSLIAQGSANLTMQRIDELECEFVEVSSHIGSRPSHAEWHGRCYHIGGPITVDGETYEDFYEGTGYKGIAGPYTALGDQLLGVNCRHSFAPWIPGSPRAYSPDPKHPSGLSNEEIYKLTQKQRGRERAIRQTKRDLAAAERIYDANPTEENGATVSKLKLQLQRQQKRMREFIKEANSKGDPNHPVLSRQPRREYAGDMPKVATKKELNINTPKEHADYRVLDKDKIYRLQEKSNATYAKLSRDEKRALDDYTDGGHNQINQYLYGTTKEPSAVAELLDGKVANIESSMDKFKLDDDIIAYSGTNANHYADWKVGETYPIDGFLSTAVTNKEAKKFFYTTNKNHNKPPIMLEVRVPAGTKCIYIGDNTAFHRPEDELLLMRGQNYRVIERTPDTLRLEIVAGD